MEVHKAVEMDLFGLTLDKLEVFVLVLIRVGAIMFLAPVFGSRNIPPSLRGGLSLVMAFLLFPIIKSPAPSSDPIVLILTIWREIFIGITIGLFVRLLLAGVEIAGQVMGFQMGLNIMPSISPLEQEDTSIISQFGSLLALMIFLGINAHHWLLMAVAKSFELISLGNAYLSGSLFEKIMNLASHMFEIAIKISAPIMASMLILNVALGILAKTVPQMNVFIVAFPLQIGLGFLILALSLPSMAYLIRSLFERMGMDIVSLLSSLGS